DRRRVRVGVEAVGVAGDLVDVVLLDVRQQDEEEGAADAAGAVGVHGREVAVGTLVVVHRQHDLLDVVGAPHAGGGGADLLDGGQEQADEDGDDGDHHQKLDQREAAPAPGEVELWHRNLRNIGMTSNGGTRRAAPKADRPA